MTGQEVAQAIAAVLHPLAFGGEGTLDAMDSKHTYVVAHNPLTVNQVVLSFNPESSLEFRSEGLADRAANR
ncbi:MAG: hypothetical protein AAGA85_01470 [Bacteroidota bacterium]